MRICCDYKVTLNSQILVDAHPIPTIDQLLNKIGTGQMFSKLDLREAYMQLELDDKSKQLTTITTQYGLFQFKRLPYGIASAPAIFQRLIDQMLSDIPFACAYLDDILITGKSTEQHLQTLNKVLNRLKEFGLKCSLKKCTFFQPSINYLGYIITKDGKKPDPSRVKAIKDMPPPKSIEEVEAFLGKVNYYGRFIPQLASASKPLNKLRRKNAEFQWKNEQHAAFESIKKFIIDATLLVHFDPGKPLILATDASSYGIGAVLLHRFPDGTERPIAHASKTLTNTERRYSQIEKEALGIIYGISKFEQFLLGRKFELFTDHRPLVSIFNPSKALPMTTQNRLYRWSIRLMSFNYVIKYKSTKEHGNADGLSRLPCGPDPEFTTPDEQTVNAIAQNTIQLQPLSKQKLKEATRNSTLFQQIMNMVKTKWEKSQISETMVPYYKVRNNLTTQNELLFKDHKVVIPEAMRLKLLQTIHGSHLGESKMKSISRQYCWWPNIDADISKLCKSCNSCAMVAPTPKSEYVPWPEPEHNWSRVHLDFLGPVYGTQWLIVIDAKSKFAFAYDVKNNLSATSVIELLNILIDLYGPPKCIVTDNGPGFINEQLAKFLAEYGIQHLNSPPYHPESNGLAERFVRTFKETMTKQQHDGKSKETALQNTLRSYRWTIHSTTNQSPAAMMYKHPIRSELNRLLEDDGAELSNNDSKFNQGQLVWALQPVLNKRATWVPAIVSRNYGKMLYDVVTSEGKTMRRHQNQIKQRELPFECTETETNQNLDDQTLQRNIPQSRIPTQQQRKPGRPAGSKNKQNVQNAPRRRSERLKAARTQN